ncbi:unnamed protein product [Anisakis simplex]|uniref:Yip1 domain-containing protein n=1 Tax=Anisakis simplex TaxID=6269 RepID=A0A0M3J7R4_ANISI|nr:unnamed protein product [Anisakis simplex]
MSGYWMDDGSVNNWYTQPNTGNQQGWAQFDYNQPQANAPPQPPPLQQPSYYSQQPISSPQPLNNYPDYYGGHMFIPSQASAQARSVSAPAEDDYENEPPLLEELGINFSHIREKTIAVLNPFGSIAPDLHFGYIYGIGGFGCLGMYGLMNLMSEEKDISFTCTTSILGYCLLPMALLSMVAAVFSFQVTFMNF